MNAATPRALQDDREIVRRPQAGRMPWTCPRHAAGRPRDGAGGRQAKRSALEYAWPRCRTTARPCWRPPAHGNALRDASAALKDDREFMLEAVVQTGDQRDLRWRRLGRRR